MKKLLLYTGTCLVTAVSNADAAISVPSANCCDCRIQINENITYSPLCTDASFCQGCEGTVVSSVVNGVCVPTCQATIQPARCIKGQYYHLGTCHDCPGDGTTKFFVGGTAITDCYMPKETTLSDASGVYIYTDDCFYSLAS